MRKRSFALPICCALLMLFVAAGCSQKEPAGVIKKSPTPINLSDSDKAYLLATARAYLEKGEQAAPSPAPPSVQGLCGREVWVSVFVPGMKYAEGLGAADCVPEGLKKAAREASRTDAFTKLEGRLAEARIKVDILDRKRKVTETAMKKLGRLLEPGVWGPMLLTEDGPVYIVPDTVVTKGWGLNLRKRGDRARRVSGSKMAKKLTREITKMAGLPKDGWKETKLYRFTTVTFIEKTPGGPPLDLYRGNALLPHEFTREQVYESVLAAGDHLLKHHNAENGTFGYLYFADTDKFDKNYGVVRHAGTVWGLFRLFNVSGEKRFLDAGLSGMEWLKRHFEIPPDAPDIVIIKVRNRAALGTMALAALATVEMPAEHMTDEMKDYQEKLGNCLIYHMLDDGRFYANFNQALNKQVPSKQPRYYPGEATLALINLYKKTGAKKWLDAAVRAAKYQIKEFQETDKPDNWSIQCMSHLYRLTDDPEFLKYGYRMADYNVRHQHKPGAPYPDYVGGFDNSRPPRSTPAGSRTEAMDEAYALAKYAKDEAAMKKYGDAIWQAMWFDMNQQFRPEIAFFLKNPEASMGGIRGSLIANDIRIDYNQHVIMAFLNGLEVFDDRPGVSTTTVFEK